VNIIYEEQKRLKGLISGLSGNLTSLEEAHRTLNSDAALQQDYDNDRMTNIEKGINSQKADLGSLS
jgi:hypothetical protein